MDLTAQVVLFALCIGFSAFFAAAEIALVSLSEARVRSMVAKHRFGSTSIKKLKDSPQRMLSTILIWSNLVNIAAASLMTVIMLGIFGNYAVSIATGITTLVVLFFGDLIPKTIAAQRNEPIAQVTAPLVHLLSILLGPIIDVIEWSLNKLFAIFGISRAAISVTEDEIKSMVAIARKEGSISENERRLVDKVFAFDEKTVGEIITPRTDMIIIASNASVRQALAFIKKHRYSRLPVYEGQKDNIVGIVALRDIIGQPAGSRVKKYMRTPYIVPENKPISDLMQRFQRRKEHMAIVVEEHGLVIGIVTLEDVLEELVGDIMDETEMHDVTIQQVADGWIVEGSMAISDANEKLYLQIPDGEYTTIGGFLLERTKHIPHRGEHYPHGDFVFTAEEVTKHRIVKVRITKRKVKRA